MVKVKVVQHDNFSFGAKIVFVDLRPFLPTFGLIGRPREREADTEKPGQRPTLFEGALWFFHMPSV